MLGLSGIAVVLVSGCGGGRAQTSAADKATTALENLSDDTKKGIAAAITSGEVTEDKPKIMLDQGVIVSRTGPDSYEVFSTICPHQGAKVSEYNAQRKTLVCPLHGSEFDAKTGEIKIGPANKPMDGKKATVEGDTVELS